MAANRHLEAVRCHEIDVELACILGGVNPMSLLPSSEAMDYKRDSLLEKARKVLQR